MTARIATLIIVPIIAYVGLIFLDVRSSTNGLPKYAVLQTIISFNINLPRKVAVANFHGLYFARPKGIYTKSSGIGVKGSSKCTKPTVFA